jgi:hypothetical protein
MERKNTGKKVVARPKVQKGKRKKMLKTPAPQRGVTSLGKVDVQRPPVSPCPSDDYDEDYVEFLKTYKPHDGYSSSSDEIDEDYPEETYPGGVSSNEGEDSCLTVDTQGKAGPSFQPNNEKR